MSAIDSLIRILLMGILSLLLWTPVLCSLILLATPPSSRFWLRFISLISTAIVLLVCIGLFSLYNPSSDLQWREYLAVNPVDIGSTYTLGIDGLSMPMLLLTSLLGWAASLLKSPPQYPKAYYFCLLILQASMLGVFLAQNWILFYIFWEVALLCVYLLIGLWGGKRRNIANLSFVIHALIGSIAMLISLLALGDYHFHHSDPLITTLHEPVKAIPSTSQLLILIGFLIGFGIQLPIDRKSVV